MKWLFSTLVALLLALTVALLAYNDPGYVMVQYRGWVIESSLTLTIVAVLGAAALVYLLTRLTGNVLRLPQRVGSWRRQRAVRRAQSALVRGFLDLYSGRYQRAEQRLVKYAGYGDTADVLNYLGAARAAQAQGADERRDRYLELAQAHAAESGPAVALTRSDLLLERGQYEAALLELNRVREQQPKNSVMLAQLLRLRHQTGDWWQLLDLLPALRKQHVIDPARADRLEMEAYRSLLAASQGTAQDLDDIWRRVPKELSRRHELIAAYAHRLAACGAPDQAENLLYRSVRRYWNEELIHQYGLIEGSQPDRQLQRAEEWLTGHETDPVLLLAVGRLCKRNALWGKARQYLEACIKYGGTPEAFNELAGVLEQMGERETALEYYRRGLGLREGEAETQTLGRPRADGDAPRTEAS